MLTSAAKLRELIVIRHSYASSAGGLIRLNTVTVQDIARPFGPRAVQKRWWKFIVGYYPPSFPSGMMKRVISDKA